jgi:hypothetical protein
VTEHNGVTCLKLTLLNPTVTLQDIKILLSLVERTAQEVLAEDNAPRAQRRGTTSHCAPRVLVIIVPLISSVKSSRRCLCPGYSHSRKRYTPSCNRAQRISQCH